MGMNRLLLAAYPAAHRSKHGGELLACLTEAYPGRSWPPPREILALAHGGAQARARSAAADTGRPWWLDGIHLSALVLAALALVPYLQDVWHWALLIDPGQHAIAGGFSGWYPWAEGTGTPTRLLPYGLLPLVCVIALLRGRPWIALPAAAGMIYAGATLGSSTLSSPTIFGESGVRGPGYYGLGAPITAGDLVLAGALFTACGVLAACRPGRLRRRSYGWLIPVALAMAVAGGLHVTSVDPNFQRVQLVLEVAALIAVWVATSATGDHRWLIPVAVFAFVRVQAILAQPTWLVQHLPGEIAILLLVLPLPLLAIAARHRQPRALLEETP